MWVMFGTCMHKKLYLVSMYQKYVHTCRCRTLMFTPLSFRKVGCQYLRLHPCTMGHKVTQIGPSASTSSPPPIIRPFHLLEPLSCQGKSAARWPLLNYSPVPEIIRVAAV